MADEITALMDDTWISRPDAERYALGLGTPPFTSIDRRLAIVRGKTCPPTSNAFFTKDVGTAMTATLGTIDICTTYILGRIVVDA